MKKKASSANMNFRPHFKTHQSDIVALWFMREGIMKITVSSVSMAYQFAEQGWQDITIAFPCNIREIESINHLGGLVKINLLVDSVGSAKFLANNLFQPTDIYIEIDAGYHRSGAAWNDDATISSILDIIHYSKYTYFKGFLTHSGNTYQAKDKEDILEIFNDTRNRLLSLKEKHAPDAIISIGDTPSCSIVNKFDGLNEIRPGNFVYYDLMQQFLGVCSFSDIAVAMACPVVSIYPNRREMVIYGGAIHFSKENLMHANEGKIYGIPVKITDNGWGDFLQESFLVRLSQEHGIIKAPGFILDQYKIGDLIGVLPVHSCLTAGLMKERSMVVS